MVGCEFTVTLFIFTLCVPLLYNVMSTYARFDANLWLVTCRSSVCMSGLGKPFIHAKVAKVTAIAMHIRIPVDITGVNAFFVLRGCITGL